MALFSSVDYYDSFNNYPMLTNEQTTLDSYVFIHVLFINIHK